MTMKVAQKQQCLVHLHIWPNCLIFLIFGAFYCSMWVMAMKANDEAVSRDPNQIKYTEEKPFYETCGLGKIVDETSGNMVILEFASIGYLLMMLVNMYLIWFYLYKTGHIRGCLYGFNLICTYLCNCGACLVNFALMIAIGAARYSDEGENCALNEGKLIADSDTTFADHGEQIQGLFISQCLLFVFCWLCALRGCLLILED